MRQMKRASAKGNNALKKALRALVPKASLADFQAIEAIASSGHLRHLPPTIIAWQAVTTHIRHNHTEYDALLSEGYDRESARHFVVDEMNGVLERWGSLRRIEADDAADGSPTE